MADATIATKADQYAVRLMAGKSITADLGSLAWSQFAEMWQQAVNTAMEIARNYLATGGEKKQAVLDAMGLLFDSLWGTVSLPWYLAWLQLPGVRSGVRAALLSATSGLIEAIYQRYFSDTEVA